MTHAVVTEPSIPAGAYDYDYLTVWYVRGVIKLTGGLFHYSLDLLEKSIIASWFKSVHIPILSFAISWEIGEFLSMSHLLCDCQQLSAWYLLLTWSLLGCEDWRTLTSYPVDRAWRWGLQSVRKYTRFSAFPHHVPILTLWRIFQQFMDPAKPSVLPLVSIWTIRPANLNCLSIKSSPTRHLNTTSDPRSTRVQRRRLFENGPHDGNADISTRHHQTRWLTHQVQADKLKSSLCDNLAKRRNRSIQHRYSIKWMG